MFNSITAIIKTSNRCNIQCSYCYVKHCQSSSQISINDLPKLIENCAKGFSLVNFVWLGGEPLIMGLEYYQAIVDIQQTYRKKGVVIKNSLQTNGTLLDDNFLSFFSKNDFGIGISFDAPYDTQIKTRTDLFTEKQWLTLFEKVKSYGLHLSFLCVITKHNIYRPKAILDFFEQVGANHFSLHPEILFEDTSADIEEINHSLSSLFISMFDLWINNKSSSIRFIDPISTMITNLYGTPKLCIFSSKCAKGLASINPNGIVIPCSSLDIPKYYFGNVLENQSLMQILENSHAKKFRQDLAQAVNNYCKKCRYVSICRNGCKSMSYWGNSQNYPLCKAYMETYDYLLGQIQNMSLGLV